MTDKNKEQQIADKMRERMAERNRLTGDYSTPFVEGTPRQIPPQPTPAEIADAHRQRQAENDAHPLLNPIAEYKPRKGQRKPMANLSLAVEDEKITEEFHSKVVRCWQAEGRTPYETGFGYSIFLGDLLNVTESDTPISGLSKKEWALLKEVAAHYKQGLSFH
jgi:hypothetical protein